MEKQCTKCHSKEILIKHPVRKLPNGNPGEFYVCSNKKCPYHKFLISEEELSQAILSAEKETVKRCIEAADKLMNENSLDNTQLVIDRQSWNNLKVSLSLPDQEQLEKEI